MIIKLEESTKAMGYIALRFCGVLFRTGLSSVALSAPTLTMQVVEAFEEMERMGLKFIGVVKTATHRFPIKYVSELELERRGEWKSVISRDADNKIVQMALVWMDRERRYFLANAGSSLSATLYRRLRCRQLNDGPAGTELTIDQPQVAEIQHDSCAKIDHHNRCRKKDLMLERKVRTLDWSFRVNSAVLGMIIVYAWLLYIGEKGSYPKMIQQHFYEDLANGLIINTYDQHGLRARKSNDCMDVEAVTSQKMSSGIGVHLTPTKRKRKHKNGAETSYALQMCCRVCKRKTTHLCSECLTTDTWLCHTSTQRQCFMKRNGTSKPERDYLETMLN